MCSQIKGRAICNPNTLQPSVGSKDFSIPAVTGIVCHLCGQMLAEPNVLLEKDIKMIQNAQFESQGMVNEAKRIEHVERVLICCKKAGTGGINGNHGKVVNLRLSKRMPWHRQGQGNRHLLTIRCDSMTKDKAVMRQSVVIRKRLWEVDFSGKIPRVGNSDDVQKDKQVTQASYHTMYILRLYQSLLNSRTNLSAKRKLKIHDNTEFSSTARDGF